MRKFDKLELLNVFNVLSYHVYSDISKKEIGIKIILKKLFGKIAVNSNLLKKKKTFNNNSNFYRLF